MLKLKTIVPKQGNIEDYINKPFLDRINGDPFDSTAIGVISDAIEVENGFELTINMFHKSMEMEILNGKISAMSFDNE